MMSQDQSHLVQIQLDRRTGDGGGDRAASETVLHDYLVQTGGAIALRLGRSSDHLLHKVGNRHALPDPAALGERVGVLLALGQDRYDAHAGILPRLLGQHAPPTAVARGQLECLRRQRCPGSEIRQHLSDLTPRHAQGRGQLGNGLAAAIRSSTPAATGRRVGIVHRPLQHPPQRRHVERVRTQVEEGGAGSAGLEELGVHLQPDGRAAVALLQLLGRALSVLVVVISRYQRPGLLGRDHDQRIARLDLAKGVGRPGVRRALDDEAGLRGHPSGGAITSTCCHAIGILISRTRTDDVRPAAGQVLHRQGRLGRELEEEELVRR